jgi:hypothetical protein
MTVPSPDDAASALPPLRLPPRPFGLRRIRQWLWQLGEVGVRVLESVTALSVHRRKNPVPKGRFEVDLARRLVVRAMRWVEALRVRLAAEAKAARGPKARRDSDFDAPEALLPGGRKRQRWEPAYKAEADDGIGDRPAAEVVAQICADLGVAAEITRSPRAAAQIAEIAAAARALLGGPEEAWTPLPVVVRSSDLAAGEVEMEVAVAPVAMPPSPSLAPDSG